MLKKRRRRRAAGIGGWGGGSRGTSNSTGEPPTQSVDYKIVHPALLPTSQQTNRPTDILYQPGPPSSNRNSTAHRRYSPLGSDTCTPRRLLGTWPSPQDHSEERCRERPDKIPDKTRGCNENGDITRSQRGWIARQEGGPREMGGADTLRRGGWGGGGKQVRTGEETKIN